MGKRTLYVVAAMHVIPSAFIIVLIWWPHTTTIPSISTPGVAMSVLGFGIIYWFFAKALQALGYDIDSNPDELVDGSTVVTYKVGLLNSHGRPSRDCADFIGSRETRLAMR